VSFFFQDSLVLLIIFFIFLFFSLILFSRVFKERVPTQISFEYNPYFILIGCIMITLYLIPLLRDLFTDGQLKFLSQIKFFNKMLSLCIPGLHRVATLFLELPYTSIVLEYLMKLVLKKQHHFIFYWRLLSELPRLIVCFAFFFDVCYFHYFYYFYKTIILLLVPFLSFLLLWILNYWGNCILQGIADELKIEEEPEIKITFNNPEIYVSTFYSKLISYYCLIKNYLDLYSYYKSYKKQNVFDSCIRFIYILSWLYLILHRVDDSFLMLMYPIILTPIVCQKKIFRVLILVPINLFCHQIFKQLKFANLATLLILRI